MEASIYIKHLKISPKKMRFAVGSLKKMLPSRALVSLKYDQTRSALILYRVVKSAIDTAKIKLNTKEDELVFKTFLIEEGTVLKRFRAGARGIAKHYKKRMSHVKITLMKTTALKKEADKLSVNLKKTKNGTKSTS